MNRAIIAVAGAGKTNWLADMVLKEPTPARTIVLTYTTTNQTEDALRIASKAEGSAALPKVMGWRSFLLNEIVRPYLPTLYPDVVFNGLAVEDPQSFMYRKGIDRYFTSDGRAYPSLLGKLSLDIIKASKYRAIERIEHLYDAFFIDEGQDLRGNDLGVLEEFLKSSITISIVLDPRQSITSTAQRDTAHKKYADAAIINLYRNWESRKLLTIQNLSETHRFTSELAHFSDLIFEPNLGFESTFSNVPPRGQHDGVFLISKQAITDYSFTHRATVLAVMKSDEIEAYESINIGLSKGMTRDDVVIMATRNIEDFLLRGKYLPPSSACRFYVAVTRAKYSVAIAVEDPEKTAAAMQSPDSLWKDVIVRVIPDSVL